MEEDAKSAGDELDIMAASPLNAQPDIEEALEVHKQWIIIVIMTREAHWVFKGEKILKMEVISPRCFCELGS